MVVPDRDDADQVVPVQAKKRYPKSISGLKTYRSCSLKWKYQKFDKVPMQPAAWLPQGTAFGRVAELWEKSGRTLTLAEQKEAYEHSFDSELDSYKERQPDMSQWLVMGRTTIEKDIASRRERGWSQWEVYRDRCLTEDWIPWELPDGTPAVEVGFELDLGFGPFRGYIDLIKSYPTGDLAVADLKTGNREDSTLQLAGYRLAANEIFGLNIRYGTFYYAKDDTWSTLYDLTGLGLEYMSDAFEAMERGIENRVFIANPGDACKLCPARNQCPEFNSIRA